MVGYREDTHENSEENKTMVSIGRDLQASCNKFHHLNESLTHRTTTLKRHIKGQEETNLGNKHEFDVESVN